MNSVVVEYVDTYDDARGHVSRRVLLNGVDLGISSDGIRFTHGDDGSFVTLPLTARVD
jgi:hypothetical protein